MTCAVFEDEPYYICHDKRAAHIRTEGHFGDIKENEEFQRFNYCSAEKVYKEFMLYAIGRNIMKYHRFVHHKIEKQEEKGAEKRRQSGKNPGS